MVEQYLKKTIDFELPGHRLRFHVTQDLFSSHQIDVGTVRLLRALQSVAPGPYKRVLDLGCGYGPLGLMLSAQNPGSRVDLVDRDALAVLFAADNAALNQLSGIDVYGSLGYDDVRAQDYDLIISNIPGKAGEAVIAAMLLDAQHYLAPGGVVAIVIVAPLAEWVAATLKAAQIEPFFAETRSGHALFFYRFDSLQVPTPQLQSGMDRGIYTRAEIAFERKALDFTLQTARGLPDFDSLSYATDLWIDGLLDLDGPFTHIAVLNPGQGFAPVLLAKRFAPQHIELIDRDLLALRYSRHNLVRNACVPASLTLSHQVGLSASQVPPPDLITGLLREEEGQPAMAHTIAQAAERLLPGGHLVIVASSTAVTRLTEAIERDKRFRLVKRKRDKGQSLLRLQRR